MNKIILNIIEFIIKLFIVCFLTMLVVFAFNMGNFQQKHFDPFEDECLDIDEASGSTANIHYKHRGTANLFCILQSKELKDCFHCLDWQRWDGHAGANIDYRMGAKV